MPIPTALKARGLAIPGGYLFFKVLKRRVHHGWN